MDNLWKPKGKQEKHMGKKGKPLENKEKIRKMKGHQGENSESEGKPGKCRKTNGQTKKMKGTPPQTGEKTKRKQKNIQKKVRAHSFAQEFGRTPMASKHILCCSLWISLDRPQETLLSTTAQVRQEVGFTDDIFMAVNRDWIQILNCLHIFLRIPETSHEEVYVRSGTQRWRMIENHYFKSRNHLEVESFSISMFV